MRSRGQRFDQKTFYFTPISQFDMLFLCVVIMNSCVISFDFSLPNRSDYTHYLGHPSLNTHNIDSQRGDSWMPLTQTNHPHNYTRRCLSQR